MRFAFVSFEVRFILFTNPAILNAAHLLFSRGKDSLSLVLFKGRFYVRPNALIMNFPW